MHRAACGTHVQPAMRCKHRADDAPDGTEGYSRGTQGYSGVLKGTRILDRMHASTLNRHHAPCGMRHARSTSAASIVADDPPDGTEGYSRGYSAAGRRACNEHSGSCNTRCAHAAWHLHPSAVARRDNKMEDRLVPSGTTVHVPRCVGWAVPRVGWQVCATCRVAGVRRSGRTTSTSGPSTRCDRACTRTHSHTHAHAHAVTHTHTHTHSHSHSLPLTHSYPHARTHTHTHAHSHSLTHSRTRTHARAHKGDTHGRTLIKHTATHRHAHLHAHRHAHIHKHTHTHARQGTAGPAPPS